MLEIIAIELNETNKEYWWGKSDKYKKEWKELVDNSPRHNAVDFFKENKRPNNKEIILVGEATTVEEKLVKCFYEKKPEYPIVSYLLPEELIETRTSFETMKSYADEMKYFIEDLIRTI